MSQRISDRAYAGGRRRGVTRRRSWLRRILLALIGVVFVVPVSLILLFRFVPPPITPLMLGTWVTDGPISRRWVPLDAISPNLVRAVIGSEDGKFCSHYGFDLAAIDKALATNARGANLRGASTISQQTAKNLFLSPDRTWARKGLEAYLTVLLEALWPKRRIMEIYLNIAEWGPRRFGAEAASEAYFHKSAAKLSVMEAARLATILPNPRNYRADTPGPYVARQSGVVAARVSDVRRDNLDSCIYR
jgi:monofunctional biosynthetic peptidoglycan transglycosylase